MSSRSQARIKRRKAEMLAFYGPSPERRGRRPAQRETLNDDLVFSLRPRCREYAVHDSDQSGLFVRVRPTGNVTFYFRPHGRSSQKAFKLGSIQSINVSDARNKAARLNQRLQLGGRINELSTTVSSGSVALAFSAFAQRLAVGEWSVRIEREFRLIVLPALGQTKLADLTYGQLNQLISARDTYYGRRNLRSILSGFLTWCVATGRIDFNVLKSAPIGPRPEPRERSNFYRPELGAVWTACDVLPSRWRDAFRLVIATGLPIQKVLQFDSNVRLAGRMNTAPLGQLADKLLMEMENPTGRYLFTAPGKTTPMRFQQRMLVKLRAEALMPSLTPRDLSKAATSLIRQRGGLGLSWDDIFPQLDGHAERYIDVEL